MWQCRIRITTRCKRQRSASSCVRVWTGPWRLCPLFVEVILDGGDDANGLHETGVTAIDRAPFTTLRGAALIGGKDGEDTLIGLANGTNFAAGIGGEALGGFAGVLRGLGDHVGLNRVERSELVSQTLAGRAAEDNSFLQ